jgi:signal transduction histidine kinase
VSRKTQSTALRTRARLYAVALLAYGVGVGYLSTMVLDEYWGFVLIVSTLLLGIATSLYFLELYETRLTKTQAQEERLEGAMRTTRVMAERLRQPLTILLGHGELLRARATGPLDPSVEEIVATAIEIEAYLCQLEVAHGLAERVIDDDDPLLRAYSAADPPLGGVPAV